MRNKVVRSMSLSPGTLELGQAVIDMYGLGKNMESKLADAVLSKTYEEMGNVVPEQTANGVRFNISIVLEFEEE